MIFHGYHTHGRFHGVPHGPPWFSPRQPPWSTSWRISAINVMFAVPWHVPWSVQRLVPWCHSLFRGYTVFLMRIPWCIRPMWCSIARTMVHPMILPIVLPKGMSYTMELVMEHPMVFPTVNTIIWRAFGPSWYFTMVCPMAYPIEYFSGSVS